MDIMHNCIQEMNEQGCINIVPQQGKMNVADILTKNSGQAIFKSNLSKNVNENKFYM